MCRKKYSVEELEGEKVVKRRPGITARSCIKIASTAQSAGSGKLDAPEVSPNPNAPTHQGIILGTVLRPWVVSGQGGTKRKIVFRSQGSDAFSGGFVREIGFWDMFPTPGRTVLDTIRP